MKFLIKLSVVAVAMSISVASAGVLNKSQISKKFQSVVPFKVNAVEDAPIPGFFQVITDRGIFYTSNDGEHIFSGSLHEFSPGLKNHTAIRQSQINEELMGKLSDKFVTFKAPNQKHEIVVFFDTSCGYCQKLHAEISQFTAQGITVHYAAWPRQGVTIPNSSEFTPNYLEMESIWCADNPEMMLNLAERGGPIPSKSCANSGVKEMYQLGESLGIRGTPAIFTLKGQEVVPGYAPAQAVLERLQKLGS
jgi:thiol:disulfide interchange protein DsbC